jgi:hypothetical protein
MKDLAPIGISTYVRIDHFKKTIKALQKNNLAKESKLFIFSDAPKKGDEDKVKEVRRYIRKINGFKKVYITERKENNGVFNNRDGMRKLLKKYGKIIFMEEDNVSHPNFLEYMNKALDFFKNDKNIFAICGYQLPINFKTQHTNNFFLSVYFGVPFATWSDRNFIDVVQTSNSSNYNEVNNDKNLRRKIKKTHPHLINALKLMKEGLLEAGDYKVNFYMRKKDLYCVTPIRSMINNIGYDGSGEHCGSTNRFDVDLNFVGGVNFTKGYKYDQKMDREFYNYKRLWIYRLPRPFKTIAHLTIKILDKLKK